ncbi:MAG: hypothetical protein QOK37_3916 [Thermoanaerobaculia bacterium]|jgi:hypothetical protein|nr:hypothetical protein [Thermoanaerobaculia bacterium]
MTNASNGPSGQRLLRRVRSIWPSTIRQRILFYLVIGALAGLACAGVDYTVDANRMTCEITTKDATECELTRQDLGCSDKAFTNGKCRMFECTKACDAQATPLTNCAFGKTNGTVAWTQPACVAKAKAAGCGDGTVFSFGCYAYECRDQRCGK